MNFNPSILIIIAIIISVVGVAAGSYALVGEYRANKAARSVDLMSELKRALETQASATEPKTLSTSAVHVGEFDAARVQRVS